ncbi:hypothetical protein Aph02nite_78250 [Actinoplanes philippinensis]|uniref:Uncharacterized protein n=1 Tax=Actinoplanes philippinensis TaxID=35752 RepID=A0A1I2KH84_9ACTN|nr:hypothetical protein [Actinoplanes philippinensis]GIE81875.1 hypothetical protein Aph02nite_78250 [Actinoplanes philippinensis]SFF64286.1 hypothetical protein SAMN05421541_11654 [Actinoplanes philippinensis]
MTVVKKRSRLITVDGVVYRWRVRRHPAHQGPLSFAIERADRRGTVLIATTPDTRPTDWVGTATPPAVPSIIAAMIREAHEQGWRPDSPGPAFPLSMDAQSWSA